MIIPRMVSNAGNRWAVAAATFLVWGLVAASAVYWAMKLSSTSASAPAAAVARSPAAPDPASTARLLGAVPGGAPAAQANPSTRFSLLGIVAGGGGGGAALIAVDGKPAKPYRIGAPIDESLVLKAVEPRRALLAPNVQAPAAVTLELPPRR